MHIYGFFIGISILAAVYVAQKLIKKTPLNLRYPDLVWDVAFYCVLGGIIGARLYHVIDFWGYYQNAPLQIIMLQKGGLGIFGGIAGGTAVLALFAIRKKLSHKELGSLFDITGVVLPLAQSIARWGNFFNYELFGKPTDSWYGLFVPQDYRPVAFQTATHFHPLFLYESLASFLLFLLLLKAFYSSQNNKTIIKMFDGDIFLLYLMGYGFIRFFLEPLRIEQFFLNGINVNESLSLIFVLVSSATLISRRLVNETGKRIKRS